MRKALPAEIRTTLNGVRKIYIERKGFPQVIWRQHKKLNVGTDNYGLNSKEAKEKGWTNSAVFQ